MKKPIANPDSGFAEEGQQAYEAANARTSFLDNLTDEQRADLELAIAEAERGAVIDSGEMFRRLSKKYNLDLE